MLNNIRMLQACFDRNSPRSQIRKSIEYRYLDAVFLLKVKRGFIVSRGTFTDYIRTVRTCGGIAFSCTSFNTESSTSSASRRHACPLRPAVDVHPPSTRVITCKLCIRVSSDNLQYREYAAYLTHRISSFRYPVTLERYSPVTYI